tara:strand:- start:3983 stop:4237 length:255 start_codon:yes stop_codon:yes gene_type:complete
VRTTETKKASNYFVAYLIAFIATLFTHLYHSDFGITLEKIATAIGGAINPWVAFFVFYKFGSYRAGTIAMITVIAIVFYGYSLE